MKNIFFKITVAVVSLLISNSVFAFNYNVYTGFGFSYINSKGLNKITDGLDQGYVTSFGKIHFPLNFEGVFAFGFDRSKVGLGLGYEFTSRNSSSDVYSITQSVNYKSIPVFAMYRYTYFKTLKWEISSGASVGIVYSKLSMRTSPSVQENETFGMKSWGYTLCGDTDVSYALSENVRLFSSLGLRYAKTGSFSYSSDTSKHSKGEKVLFSDGSNLTLNLSGLKFLVGIMLNWG